MAPILESYRNVIYGNLDGSPAAPNVVGLGIAFAASCVLLVVGILLFKRMEPAFAKVV
jgi:ABC-type polysaccharide/polyol phosphate export permease